jgi:hypothetical protein
VPIDVSSLPLAPMIDDDRIVPRWSGERFDPAACVELVLTARGAGSQEARRAVGARAPTGRPS